MNNEQHYKNALEKIIREVDNKNLCRCDHDDEYCCVVVKEYCPVCIADTALIEVRSTEPATVTKVLEPCGCIRDQHDTLLSDCNFHDRKRVNGGMISSACPVAVCGCKQNYDCDFHAERRLERRRELMPDYDESLKEWLS